MSTGEEPPAKKSRSEDTPAAEESDAPANASTEHHANAETETETETETSPLDVFSNHILDNAEQYAKTYSDAKPYSHGVLEQLFVDGFAGEYCFISYTYVYYSSTRSTAVLQYYSTR